MGHNIVCSKCGKMGYWHAGIDRFVHQVCVSAQRLTVKE